MSENGNNLNSNNLGDQAERAARFEYLMDQYLERKATDSEKDELRAMVQHGFGDRYKERLDETLESELTSTVGEDMPAYSRQEILVNIFDRTEPARQSFHWRWAAAAAVLFVAASGGFLFLRNNQANEENSKPAITQSKKITTAVYSGKQYVSLADGSSVILNEHSTLIVNESFNNQLREVSLTGEAYFDIHHDPSKPFIVTTGAVKTTVLGTAFNIAAYPNIDPNKAEIKVTVTRGKVKVANKEKILGVITPDQQIAVNVATDEFKKIELKAEKEVEWKATYLIFDNMSLEAAAVLLEERFNVKISFAREELKACRVHASFLNGESIDKVLNVIGILLNGTTEKLSDGTIVIDGKGC